MLSRDGLIHRQVVFTSNIYPTCTNKGNEIYNASSENINYLRLPLTYQMKMNAYSLQMSGGSELLYTDPGLSEMMHPPAGRANDKLYAKLGTV